MERTIGDTNNMKLTIKPTPVRTPKTFTLELDDIEAAFLFCVMRHIGGHKDGFRGIANEIETSLSKDVDQRMYEDICIQSKGDIYFNSDHR
jgi:hypothetical protein